MAASFELARLVTTLIADRTQLDAALDAVQQKLKQAQQAGNQKLVAKWEKELQSLRVAADENLGRLRDAFARTAGGGDLLTMALGKVSGSLGTTVAGAVALGAAAGAVAAGIGLIAVGAHKAAGAFLEWHDQIIRVQSVLHALGRGSVDETANMLEWSKQLALNTGASRKELMSAYEGLRRETIQGANPELASKQLAEMAVSLSALSGGRKSVDDMAGALGRAFEITHTGRGDIETLRTILRQLGPEYRIHNHEIKTAADFWALIVRRAELGKMAVSEQASMVSRQNARLALEVETAWQKAGEAFGPIRQGIHQVALELQKAAAKFIETIGQGLTDLENFARRTDAAHMAAFERLARHAGVPGFTDPNRQIAKPGTEFQGKMAPAQPEPLAGTAGAAGFGGIAGAFTAAMSEIQQTVGKGTGSGAFKDFGMAGGRPEITGFAEAWKKMQTAVLTHGQVNPIDLQQKTNALLDEQLKETKGLRQDIQNQKQGKAVAVAG